ncbi:MAG: DMT family transporter [Hyphomicrobiaceae bacterium]|nr:DMT family transporter [Hyphomicrobiaceae bacterium]MCC0023711.1 DMT family transporter [Hyphomicrobiaceae bacterium]
MPQPDSAPQSPPDLIGYVLAIGGALFFATKGIFIKLAYFEGTPTETVLALRMLVAVPLYLAILGVTLWRTPELIKRLTLRNVLAAAGVGSLGYYAASYLDFAGLNFVSAQYERLVLFTYPFFTVGLGIAFFGHTMKKGIIPAMLVSWAGLAVIFGWNLTIRTEGLIEGTLLVLASGLLFALYQLLAKNVMAWTGTLLFTCIGMSSAGLIAISQDAAIHGFGSLGNLSPTIWAYGLALGIVGTILPSFMLNAAIHRVGARVTSATGTFGPIMTIALAVIVLKEPFTIFHAAGAALVVLGAVLFSRAERKPVVSAQSATVTPAD